MSLSISSVEFAAFLAYQFPEGEFTVRELHKVGSDILKPKGVTGITHGALEDGAKEAGYIYNRGKFSKTNVDPLTQPLIPVSNSENTKLDTENVPFRIREESTFDPAELVRAFQASQQMIIPLNPNVSTGSKTASIKEESIVIPKIDRDFVPFGIYDDLKKIISSKVFAPIMIVGDSGNGKSYTVIQTCARTNRAIVPVSIDISTTEDDLIGHYGLVDGNTVYEKGPVRIAAETGSILLLDELDRGNPENLICLNMILDGYDIIDKKTGDRIVPAPGFQVIATANTKGQGDDSDRFVAAKIMDEAFLERFHMVLEQDYPSASVETKILSKKNSNEEFCSTLVKWANVTRETYKAGGVDNFITTRRLVFIAGKNFSIFGDKNKAVEVGISRFPSSIREPFMEMFKALSDDESSVQVEDPIPFDENQE
jgi:hypothetical protein